MPNDGFEQVKADWVMTIHLEAHLGRPCETSMMAFFAKLVNCFCCALFITEKICKD